MKLMRFEGTNKLAYKAVRVKEAQKYAPLMHLLQILLISFDVLQHGYAG